MSESHKENATAPEQRSAELKPGSKGKFEAAWRLTDTKLSSPVRISFPPIHAIPIIFVPGIMGSNLCNLDDEPVWLLNSIRDIPVRLAWDWSTKGPAARQEVLHPARTKVFKRGAVPNGPLLQRLSPNDYLRRGWGEISEASYHKFLLWLDNKMNGDRDPANWDDFSAPSFAPTGNSAQKTTTKLFPGLVMVMRGMPSVAESGHLVEPIRSDELLRRSKSTFPVYAFGYNWLASNDEAAIALKDRIAQVIAENNAGGFKCSQVILVTHSMGGLVARACSQLPEMSRKIVGIVHGVMPATGAAVAYRRCKVGMNDEDAVPALVIGSNGQEVTAVFAQSPGALQLLPSEEYGTGWLEIKDPKGGRMVSLPNADPYEEIYLQKEKWWGLIREDWLRPDGGMPISWKDYVINIRQAKEFHRRLAKKYHEKTYIFYGGGAKLSSFAKISWDLKNGSHRFAHRTSLSLSDVPNLGHKEARTDGSNKLYFGGESIVYTTTRGDAAVALPSAALEVQCADHDSAGDGTVPSRSGRAPRDGGGKSILQQFELEGIEHEPAYRDHPAAQQVAYYAITKLAAFTEFS